MTTARRVAITGASGFIGRALVNHLLGLGVQVTALSRSTRHITGAINRTLPRYVPSTDLDAALRNVDVVVHLAARAHGNRKDDDTQFSDNLPALQAVLAASCNTGVRRFVLMSSIGVNGNATHGRAFREIDTPAPAQSYARSKLLCEAWLQSTLQAHQDMDWTIIRPPLVYGDGAPGNFSKLMRGLRRGIPFPLASIDNKRSLLALDNLLDFVSLCINHPRASREIFLVADGEDLSTPDLLRRTARAMGIRANLLAVSPKALALAAAILGRKDQWLQLCGSLQVDSSKARSVLGWAPRVTVDEGLRRARGDSASMMKRALDLAIAIVALPIVAVPLMLAAALVRLTSPGPVLYWSDRIGRHNAIFRMPKFRSMRIDTPALATHLLERPEQYLTPIGSFLRKSSLDELPQLWSILKGDMSFVGPRPALFNQHDLIALRTQHGVDALLPGLTGWAQIHGRDELPIPVKVEMDVYYLHHRSLGLDLAILWRTVAKVVRRDGVAH